MKTETMLERVDHFLVADDHATLVVRDGKRLRALPAERPEDERALKSDKPSRESGWIDLNRVRLSVSPTKEWRQMLARSVAAAARPVLGSRHVGHRLGSGLRALRAAARQRVDAKRAV